MCKKQGQSTTVYFNPQMEKDTVQPQARLKLSLMRLYLSRNCILVQPQADYYLHKLLFNGFIEKQNIDEISFGDGGIDVILEKNDVFWLSFVKPYVNEVVLEFYENLLK